MNLIHYSEKPIIFDYDHSYKNKETFKPNGFWVSVLGEDDWPSWCKGAEFALSSLSCPHRVILRSEANVFLISSKEELDAFNVSFKSEGGFRDDYKMKWVEVRRKYDGLIIAPYQYSRRLVLLWYYAWDCASGVIWNLNAIKDCVLLKGE